MFWLGVVVVMGVANSVLWCGKHLRKIASIQEISTYTILSDASLALYLDWSMFLAAVMLANVGAYKGGVGHWRHTKAFWESQMNSLLNFQRTKIL